MVDGAEGERARGFELRAGVIALKERGVAGVNPEDAGDGDHQKNGEDTAAPVADGGERRVEVQGRSLDRHAVLHGATLGNGEKARVRGRYRGWGAVGVGCMY